MRHPESVLAQIRTCVHSHVVDATDEMRPDFACTIKPGDDQATPCALLSFESCAVREEIPEHWPHPY